MTFQMRFHMPYSVIFKFFRPPPPKVPFRKWKIIFQIGSGSKMVGYSSLWTECLFCLVYSVCRPESLKQPVCTQCKIINTSTLITHNNKLFVNLIVIIGPRLTFCMRAFNLIMFSINSLLYNNHQQVKNTWIQSRIQQVIIL